MVAPEAVWASSSGAAIRQCELLSNVSQAIVLREGDRAQVTWIRHPWALALSQDCDTDFDYTLRQVGGDVSGHHKELPNILFVQALEESELRSRKQIDSDIWRRIKSNQDERFHVMEPVPDTLDAQHQGVPMLVLDFKRVFTVPSSTLYQALEDPDDAWRPLRRSFALPPFREFASTRALSFLGRVAVPD